VAQLSSTRRIFRRHNPEGPYHCYFCEDEIRNMWDPYRAWKTPVVHHLDHDRRNNSIENLVPAHWRCHWEYHKTEGR
jgi:hypothetical protein